MADDKRNSLSFGDLLHGIQIAVMLATLGIFYQQIQSGLEEIRNLKTQTTRIEHYLSSKDPHYWEHAEKQ